MTAKLKGIAISARAADKTNRSLLLLLLVCVAIRIVIWFSYEPIAYPDTARYVSFALQIRRFDFRDYDGARTPGYPLMLLLGGIDYKRIWFMQSVLGICTSLLLFTVAHYQTRSTLLSFLIGLSHSLSLIPIFFEAHILTETLSTFLVVLSLLLYVRIRMTRENNIASWLLLALVVSLAWLTRPLLLILAFIYPLFLFFRCSSTTMPTSERIKCLLSFTVPVAIIVLGWLLFIAATVDYFGLTTLAGYSLTNHSGAFIELAPDEYSKIRDVYLEFRQQQITERGTHVHTIWPAVPEMLETTGLSFSELSEELTRMSITLFIQHPTMYFQSVSRAWLGFWKPRIYWKFRRIKIPLIAKSLKLLWEAERRLGIIVSFLFLIVVIHSM